MTVGVSEKLRLRVSRRDLDFEAEGEKATVMELYREICKAPGDPPAAPPPFANHAAPEAVPPELPPPPASPAGTRWNEDRRQWLRRVYPDTRFRVAAIAAALGMPTQYVYNEAVALELSRGVKGGPAGMRKCLGCGCAFASEGKHQRLCVPCRGKGAGLDS